MDIYAIHRPELMQVNTTFSVGSGMVTSAIDIGKYNNLTALARVDSGNATLDLRFSPTSAFTVANSKQISLSNGVTSVFSYDSLVGRYVDMTISGVNSNANVQAYIYGLQT